MKKLFFLDYKTIDDLSELPGDTNSVLNILKRYSLGIGDYEQNGFTKAIFNSLGWNTQFRDTMFSFHRIICKIFEVYSNENEIKLNDGKRIVFYIKNNRLEYKINDIHNALYLYCKGTLYKNVTDPKKEKVLSKVMYLIEDDKEVFNELEIVAGLVDSLSNFTPHPGDPFNQAKGTTQAKGIPDVADNLNLMIDKVQNCIDENKSLEYKEGTIEKEELIEWKEWFIRNRKKYFLDGIYDITGDNKIKGKQLFDEQSLEKPLPTTREEIIVYLRNIKELLYKRGEKMNEKMNG